MQSKKPLTLLAPMFLAGTIIVSAPSWAAVENDSWNPVVSERLIKLPANYLKKAVDHDFSKSALAAAIADNRELTKLKTLTLQDLQSAIEGAEGELRIELRHQFLAEKRAYLELVARTQDLRRRQADTKIKLYGRMLDKLGAKAAAMTPQHAALVEKQKAAQKRFQSSIGAVDMKLFGNAAMTESKYSQEYAKNVASIERLVAAIESHPMNRRAEIDGQAVSKQDYLRQIITEAEADVALLDQEETVLGYMAKLIALDAMALSDAVVADELAPGEAPAAQGASVNAAIDFFVTR
ncbi:MAG: hypothetical protein OXT06_27055 [Rhodospirillaceae bacterium]|nr:hypothetical protein [Rhodospirillaceae bacterium]MDD9926844.1 hypothetical protein [Rhodospirillaceae bacterium]